MKRLSLFVLIAILVLSITGTVIADGPAGRGVETLPGAGWWTSFTLQNPGSSGNANFQVAAHSTESPSNQYDAAGCSVGAGASVIYNPNQTPNIGSGGTRIGFSGTCGADGNDSLPTSFEGGAVVSSDQPLVAVVSVGNNPTGSASAFYQGFSGDKANTKIIFPVAKNNFYGQTTTYYIQAVEDASVTVTYSNGTTDGPYTINAGETRVFDMPSGVDGNASYSAVAESTSGKMVGSVVEHPATASPATFALSTRAFTPDEADTTVYLPSVKNEFYNGTTGAAVQAVGGGVTVEVDFAITNSEPGASCSNATSAQVTLADGESAIFGGGADKNLPAGFGDGCFGSATVRVVSGTGKVVATVNETSSAGKAVYSGFPASAASQTVAIPLAKEVFYNGRTAIVVQVVGASSASTNITAKYVNGGACTGGCSITPSGGGAGTNPISGGAAANFRKLNDFSSEYSGSLPAVGTNNAVVITSDSLPVVAIAQETVTGLDVKNYEGFPQ